MADENITFIPYQTPRLAPGQYTLQVDQLLAGPGIDSDETASTSTRVEFNVQGERFLLDAGEVHSVFPPEGSLGEYATVLPHLVLNRKTLPWERKPEAGSSAPWLALLVFRPSELKYPSDADQGKNTQQQQLEAEDGLVKTLGDIKTVLGLTLETGQTDEDKTSVIYAEQSALQEVIPLINELPFLAHIRKGEDEQAVVIANRLPDPTPGSMNIVHLVSLENRFDGSGAFDYSKATSDDLIPLVSLKSWRFACVHPRHTFHGTLLHLNQEPAVNLGAKPDALTGTSIVSEAIGSITGLLEAFTNAKQAIDNDALLSDTGISVLDANGTRYIIGQSNKIYNQAGMAMTTITGAQDATAALQAAGLSLEGDPTPVALTDTYWWITDGSKTYFLYLVNNTLHSHLLATTEDTTLKLPKACYVTADHITKQGFVPVPHFFREGSKSASWYRGPFLPAPGTAAPGFDTTTLWDKYPDALLRYFEDVGMLDVSYAAAWELGRLLALNSKTFSITLDKWKRQKARTTAVANQALAAAMPVQALATDAATTYEDTLTSWLANLKAFEGIPFNYLLPDERLLPKESLRFFYFDTLWMDALIGGAFSIGRGRQANDSLATDIQSLIDGVGDSSPVMGFFLRSDVVSGWPGLLVEGAATDEVLKAPILQKQIAPKIILCLFDIELEMVDFHLKPEVLHFGFEREEETYYKRLRKSDGTIGTETGDRIELTSTILSSTNQVLDISGLVTAIEGASGLGFSSPLDAAGFAVAMIAGVERVRFKKGSLPAEGSLTRPEDVQAIYGSEQLEVSWEPAQCPEYYVVEVDEGGGAPVMTPLDLEHEPLGSDGRQVVLVDLADGTTVDAASGYQVTVNVKQGTQVSDDGPSGSVVVMQPPTLERLIMTEQVIEIHWQAGQYTERNTAVLLDLAMEEKYQQEIFPIPIPIALGNTPFSPNQAFYLQLTSSRKSGLKASSDPVLLTLVDPATPPTVQIRQEGLTLHFDIDLAVWAIEDATGYQIVLEDDQGSILGTQDIDSPQGTISLTLDTQPTNPMDYQIFILTKLDENLSLKTWGFPIQYISPNSFTNNPPFFPGTMDLESSKVALENFIVENFEYPQEATDQGIKAGNWTANLLIDTAGSLTATITESDGVGFEEEGNRIIGLLAALPNKWTPAHQDGLAIQMSFELFSNFVVNNQQIQLWPLDSARADDFGFAITISGDGKDLFISSTEVNEGRGKVYIFSRNNNGNWLNPAPVTQILHGDEDAEEFGYSIALSADGKTAFIEMDLIMANHYQTCVYKKSENGVWERQSKYPQVNGSARNGFTASVALSADGKTALIGLIGDSGQAYIFTQQENGDWQEQLLPVNGNEPEVPIYFGTKVGLSIDGKLALVGATGQSSFDVAGKVYVFEKVSDGTWQNQGLPIQPEDSSIGYFFGTDLTLSVDGKTLAIWGSGKVYIFERQNDNSWLSVQTFDDDIMLVALSANGRYAGSGSTRADNWNGRAYIYKKEADDSWSRTRTIEAADHQKNPVFGSSVTLSPYGEIAFVGSWDSTREEGTVFLFPLKEVLFSFDYQLVGDQVFAPSEVDQPACFPGTSNFEASKLALEIFIATNFVYPDAAKTAGINAGGWTASFIIEKDGSLSNITITNSDGDVFEAEGNRVTGLLPGGWSPAQTEDEEAVRMSFGLTSSFVLNDQMQKYSVPDGIAYGYTMALSRDGRTLLISKTGRDAKLFPYSRQSDANWLSTAPVTPFFETDASSLSIALSANGSMALVGLDSVDSGVYLFRQQAAGTWEEQTMAPQIDLEAQILGTSVSLSADGKTALVGSEGKAFVFSLQSDETWEAYLMPAIGGKDGIPEMFGFPVAISADGMVALVGMPRAVSYRETESVYVFDKLNDGSWQMQAAPLQADNGVSTPGFGAKLSLAADGQTVIIGSSASVYIFERQSDGSWTQTERSDGSWIQTKDFFPPTVAMDAGGKLALVGVPVADDNQGKVYVLRKSGEGSWRNTDILEVDPRENYSGFGIYVHLSPHGELGLVAASNTVESKDEVFVFPLGEALFGFDYDV